MEIAIFLNRCIDRESGPLTFDCRYLQCLKDLQSQRQSSVLLWNLLVKLVDQKNSVDSNEMTKNCFLECNCHEEGTINGDVCDKINGQCQCKKYQWSGVRCQIPISKLHLSTIIHQFNLNSRSTCTLGILGPWTHLHHLKLAPLIRLYPDTIASLALW